MSLGRKQYPFALIEPKWQKTWESLQAFRAWNPREQVPADHIFRQRHASLPPKCYILDMFPYPSGAGLHVGHPEGYTATDILARYKRALGFNVLHPMGWDAFGLPAEQYAIRTGQHPRQTTAANVANFKRQIQSLGFSYDWSREVNTTDPHYFRWTQWIFLQLYNSWFNPRSRRAEPIETLICPAELATPDQRRDYLDAHRLAYVSEAPVNWCPELGTVLANEEVIEGRSEVGNHPVIRKPMRQWMLRITAYADRLLEDLDPIDWSPSLKEMQRNWIGKSVGAEVLFRVDGMEESVRVFTTRPDTLFGATYLVLAPEHPLVARLASTAWPDATPEPWKGSPPAATPKEAVLLYQARAAAKSDLERTELAKEKTGVFIGAYAIHPANGSKIPIWVADYVLSTYGTGAIMAVPAHDERDLEFATQYDLPVRVVVQAPDQKPSCGYVGEGVNVSSGFLDGLPTPQAKLAMAEWLQANGLGRQTTNYKLRDWLFSRQRYWGEPFPIVWKDGRHGGLRAEELPVLPPELSDYKPTSAGEPPLARATEWVQVEGGRRRETNTMPQWAGSCWYYLRYLDPRNELAFCDPEAEAYWMGTKTAEGTPDSRLTPGVDLYVGGTEHAVLHLLYARFWHKVLFDLGFVTTPEPFHKLVNQGLILGEDGQKMSKSIGNVINPDEILAEYGADAFRLYEMFMGPLEMVKPWNTRGVEGVYRFLGRTWRLFVSEASETELEQASSASSAPAEDLLKLLRLRADIQDCEPAREQLKALHACVKKVTEDLEGLRFNTAISALMVFVNEAIGWTAKPRTVLHDFLLLLQPFAPHLAEELYQLLMEGSNPPRSMTYLPWPQFDPKVLVESEIEIPVQINGKVRERITIPTGLCPQEVETFAMQLPKIKQLIEGKSVKKVIIVPGRLVNIALA